MNTDVVPTSKFLSLILRHQPEKIGLSLDANGWANIDDLLRLSAAKGRLFTRALIEEVVETNDKQRFVFNEDRSMIRANQGHSVSVDLGLTAVVPPPVLFHGTAARFLESIQTQGLLKGNRQYVHLSLDEATAIKVGQRHGKPVVLKIATGRMQFIGHKFYCSANGVWLTEYLIVFNEMNEGGSEFEYWHKALRAQEFEAKHQPYTITMKSRLPEMQNYMSDHRVTLQTIAEGKAPNPEFRRIRALARAKTARDQLFKQFDQVIAPLLPQPEE